MGYRYFEQAAHAAAYNKFRPSTPKHLIEKIVKYIQEQHPGPLNEAVDIGCGSGQSTEVLAPYFKKVTGSDPSETQIIEAQKKNTIPNVHYKVGPAEKIDCPDESVQLITACQSCHWFDLPKFYSEAERILVPGGVLAMYGYVLPRPRYENKSEELSEIVDKYYNIVLGKYVLPQSKKAYLENYSTKDFNEIPFVSSPVVRDDSIYIERKAALSDLIGYMSSWSTFQNFQKQEGEERASCVLQDLEKELLDMTEPSKKPQDIQIMIIYKYFLLMARKPLKKIAESLQ
ncbi:putative methyltransferase DDB_G0268948 [Anabrus simplex]|uniref:putative methyltransferase DDB_G0268948 n=1 Tax=Anabrus simplex TaxID=316456 RepID=UPI0035A3565C